MKNQSKSKIIFNENKKISVIIAVRNEEDNILKCLNTLLTQKYNKTDFEIIIIDDNSIDKTCEVILQRVKDTEVNVQLYHLIGKTSKKEALKLGIEKSSYPIIATTDADCSLPENWLNHISLQFNKKGSMLLGPVMFKNTKGFLPAFQVLDMLAIQGLEFGTLGFNSPILNNAANLSFYKEKYLQVNGYDSYKTPSGDDIFLLEKFKRKEKNEIKGLLSNEFIVETIPENNFSSFFNQRLRWSSKAKYYSDKLLIYFGSIIFIQNIVSIFIYVQLPLVEKYRDIFIILLLTKWVIDFILLFLVACFFERRKALFYFIPVQIVYPIYIVFISIISMMTKYEWKGRKYNG